MSKKCLNLTFELSLNIQTVCYICVESVGENDLYNEQLFKAFFLFCVSLRCAVNAEIMFFEECVIFRGSAE